MERGIIKKLKEFGLSDKGARIYVALLELELATVSELAKHSGVNRSSTYVVLERLKKKGLAGVSDDKKVRRYVASSPELLLHTAKDKANKHKKIKESIESIVPELNALHKEAKHRPVVRVFEGEEGLKQVYFDVFTLPIKEFRVYEDLSGIIIEHKEIAEAMKSGFDLAFKEARRLQKELGIKRTHKSRLNTRTSKSKKQ